MSQLVKNGTIANMKDFLATDDSYVKEEDSVRAYGVLQEMTKVFYGLSVDS